MKRAHEHGDVDRCVRKRQRLRAPDEVAGPAVGIASQRGPKLLLRDLEADRPSAAAGELADERAAAAADVENVLAVRRDKALEHRDVGGLLAAHGLSVQSVHHPGCISASFSAWPPNASISRPSGPASHPRMASGGQ